jgi:hypothetical protein
MNKSQSPCIGKDNGYKYEIMSELLITNIKSKAKKNARNKCYVSEI